MDVITNQQAILTQVRQKGVDIVAQGCAPVVTIDEDEVPLAIWMKQSLQNIIKCALDGLDLVLAPHLRPNQLGLIETIAIAFNGGDLAPMGLRQIGRGDAQTGSQFEDFFRP